MNKLIIVVGLVTSCLNVFAAIGDSYECKTIDIAIINDNQATTNVEPLTFSFAMKHLSLDVESYIGQLSFSQSAIGTLVDNEYGNSLYMDTFDGKERAMASIGTTMAWYDKGDLTISSMYKDNDSKVYQMVSSVSKCTKL